MAQLSGFANVTSVVGAADIVIRSVKELYNFVEHIAAAPEDRLQLKSTLEKVTEAVSTARQYAEQYRGSVYVVEDGLKPLQGLENLLKNCNSEINQLNDVIKAFTLVPKTKFQDFKLRLGFVSRERAIKTACDRLQWQMVQIMLNLQVANGKHDIVLREKVGLVDMNIANVLSRQDKGFQDSQQAQFSSTYSTQKMILDLDHRMSSNHETSLQVANLLVAKIDEVSRYFISVPSNSTGGSNISFKGRGLEYLIVPLSQVPLYLQHIFQTLILERRMLSSLDRDWIGMELAHLLASAHEAAACSLRKLKLPSVFDHQSLPFLIPMKCGIGDFRPEDTRSTLYEDFPETGAIRTSRLHAIVRTQGGLLTVECIKKYQSQQACNENYEYLELRLLFSSTAINTTREETTGVFLLLSRDRVSMNSEPQLTRFIREVNVVSRNSKAFQCVKRNDAAGLRQLFINREASPFDYTESGRSLLCEAALGLQLECVELLLEQGADSLNCHLGSSKLTDLSYVIWRTLSGYYFHKMPYSTIRKRLPLTAKAIGQRFDIDWACELENVCDKSRELGLWSSRPFLTYFVRLLHQKGQNETVLFEPVLDAEFTQLRMWQKRLLTEGAGTVKILISYSDKMY